jgi:exosome complex component MTR3
MVTLFPCLLQVTQMQLTGDWSAGQVKEGLELAMGGCQQLRAVMRQTLLEAALGAAADEQDGAVEVDGAMVE